ncbi:RstC protein [Vibrio genomosp. F6]|nr:RstC protein [Vibrio genomosp. F6]
MTIKGYTFTDAESKLNDISNISVFLSTGSCPKEISFGLIDHMHDEIETLQGILSFIRELKLKTDQSKS